MENFVSNINSPINSLDMFKTVTEAMRKSSVLDLHRNPVLTFSGKSFDETVYLPSS